MTLCLPYSSPLSPGTGAEIRNEVGEEKLISLYIYIYCFNGHQKGSFLSLTLFPSYVSLKCTLRAMYMSKYPTLVRIYTLSKAL